MNRVILLILLTIFNTNALADWDPELEAQEQAQREAAQRAEQAREREAQKMIDAANAKANREMMDSKRKNLGAATKGKSDAEVNRLYDAKIKQTTEDANRLAQEARSALSQGQGAAAVKQVTGKSLQELENMSDEEAEALSRELEKKYGQ
ncbi:MULTISPECIES: hypothetical protein [Methylomonas]|uniref:Uncharacterized protein n=2 Tax=Methylomonas TaxID=416 RepID=A0A126T262_9GAMM|nr:MULTISPECIES: hypothetical protein [Methylomonas]AMK76176.1 hypothetical protein JT25_006670 [Methylomonas denitrificans]OAH96041.1 hypothetical protein A1342_14040 [Methylomonas methanica]TCV81326.1 hypothetical protein EDE11_11527 [Methylomonas methanica]